MAEIVNIYICFQNIPLNCFLIQICLKRNKKLTKNTKFFPDFLPYNNCRNQFRERQLRSGSWHPWSRPLHHSQWAMTGQQVLGFHWLTRPQRMFSSLSPKKDNFPPPPPPTNPPLASPPAPPKSPSLLSLCPSCRLDLSKQGWVACPYGI